MEDFNEEVAPVGKLESFLLNQDSPTPELNNKPKIKNQDDKNYFLLQKRIEEQGKEIKELKIENETLKKQLNEAFQNIISIYNRLDKYNKLEKLLIKLN